MKKRVTRSLERLLVRFLLVFKTSESHLRGDGAVREVHCFNFKGGFRFGIVHGDDILFVGSWWTVTLRLNRSGELVECRFERNRMKPGDVRLTGKKLRRALQNWMAFRPVRIGDLS